MEHTAEWLTEQTTADWLGVPVQAVQLGIAAGELPVLALAGEVRISRTALLELARRKTATDGHASAAARPAAPELLDELPAPAGFSWLGELTPTAGFVHGWPQHGGGYYKEPYPDAWEASIRLKGRDQTIKVGRSSGQERNDKRPRLTVFLDAFPVAEFIPTADGTKLASVIKPNGKKTISSPADLPALYRNIATASYTVATGLSGIGRPKGLAVLINPDDLRSAVHHAAARRLGRLGEVVRPAS